MRSQKNSASGNLGTTVFLATIVLLVVAWAASPSRAEGVKYVTFLYTGDLNGEVLPRKG